MLAVTYRKGITSKGLTHLPYKDYAIDNAKRKADDLFEKGYLNVKVIKLEQEVLYTPGEKNEEHN